ncbi:MAG: hypothetical protein ACRD2B_15290 [Terriglobia bacterium]
MMAESASGISSPRARSCQLFSSALLLVLLLPSLPLRADEFHTTEHYRVRMFSYGTFTLNTRMGDIEIEGWNNPHLAIEAEKDVQARSQKKAERLYSRVRVEIQGQDHNIFLRTIYPRRRPWRPFRDESKISVNFTIHMPYDANVRLKCVDGDVTVSGLTGKEVLDVNYGDVEIDVPNVYRLRLLDARTWLGYVESDLHGMPDDAAGFGKTVSFNNLMGTQVIIVHVRMGGVFVYGDDDY